MSIIFSYLKKHNLIIKFALSYAVIFAIPILFGSVVYNEVVNVIELNIKEANQSSLEHISQNVDRRISEMKLTVEQYLDNPKIQSFQTFSQQDFSKDVFKVVETRNSIMSHKTSNSFIIDCFFMFNESQLVLSNDLTYTYQQFYDKILSFSGISYEEWQAQMSSASYKNGYLPAQLGKYWGKEQDLLVYQQSYNFLSPERGSIILVLNGSEIGSQLQQLNISEDGWVYAVDSNGNLLSSTKKEADLIRIDEAGINSDATLWNSNVNGKEMMISRIKSKENGFNYISVQPEEVIFSKANSVKKLIFSTMLISVLIGLVVSSILIYRYSQPLMKIISDISKYFSKQDNQKQSLTAVQKSVSLLLGDNTELKTLVDAQKPFLLAAFFRQLISNEFISEEEINRTAISLNINLQNGGFQVILIELNSNRVLGEEEIILEAREYSGVCYLVKEFLASEYDDKIQTLDISESVIALFLSDCPAELAGQADIAQAVLTLLKEKLPQPHNLNLIAAVGSRCSSMYEIPLSYEHAQCALKSCIFNAHSELVWYDSSHTDSGFYYFPTELQARISNAVCTGNAEEVNKQLHKLYQENIVTRSLSGNMTSLLIQNLWSNLMQIIQPLALAEETSAEIMTLYQQSIDSDEVRKITLTNKAYLLLCNTFNEKKESKHKQFISSIIEYVNKSYSDPNLGLAYVAEHHQISEAYLSNIFTQETGENYSVYIENLRMKKATELILSTSLTIQEIALRVGYYSSNTFCRAFKRVNGISATAYRVNNKPQD